MSLLNPQNTLKEAHQILYNHFRSRIAYLDGLQLFYLQALKSYIQNVAN